MRMMTQILFLPVTAVFLAAGCGGQAPVPAEAPESTVVPAPTAADAKAFVVQIDDVIRKAWVDSETAAWARSTNITPETEKAASAAAERQMAAMGKAIKDSRRFDGVEGLDADTARRLALLKRATVLPAPDDDAKRAELAGLATTMEGIYGTGKYCAKAADGSVDPSNCKTLDDLSATLAESRDYDVLLDAWTGWRTISPPMRPMYTRFAELGNAGAKDLGYSDLGALWRSGYDMAPEAFEAEVDRLYEQVKPLYEQLHCYVRAELGKKYGVDKVPADGPIPAHLLGNMWAQSWSNLYPDIEPFAGQPSIDVTKALVDKGYDEVKMVKLAEGFFTSLGMDPLPASFWERSMFKRPADREVVCHASAWDPAYNNDLRIKMCVKIDQEDLVTIHHELGHIYYYHNYFTQPAIYQQGANDGFHEGIGDTLALSVTPGYLNQLGLLGEVSADDKAVINNQMQVALGKIAFLPFGLVVDKWRWGVFDGRISPENYNAGWWELRQRYQGVAPPVARSEADFDPGAKYHIPANTPYARYFLAAILQFQFHEALCKVAGHEGPIHTCSIYGSKEAGAKLKALLAMGATKPWPDALEAIAGTREMDGHALINYFQPLMTWLAKQNEGRSCGWDSQP